MPTWDMLEREGFLLGEGMFSVYLYQGLAYKLVHVNSRSYYDNTEAREIQTMKLLSEYPNCHPNIVCLKDVYFIHSEYGHVVGTTREFPKQGGVDVVLVMEKIEGMTLNKLIYRNPGSRQELAHLMLQIIDVVAYLHSRDIYHRDIKPGNIMVTVDHTVKLIDFGYAIHWPKERTKDAQGVAYGGALLQDMVGTPYYILPEMIEGKTYHGREADIWSMGMTFLDMIQGYGIDEVSGASNDERGDDMDIDQDIAQNMVNMTDEFGHIGSRELYIKNGNRPLLDFVESVVPSQYRRQPPEEWDDIYSMIRIMLMGNRQYRLTDLTMIRQMVSDWATLSF